MFFQHGDVPLWLCLTRCRARRLQAWRWRCTESRAVGQRHGRKGICRGAGRAWRLPMPHCRDHCSPLWTFPVCPGVICTGMTTRKPFIDPPSYAVNKESEAQQMNHLPNFIQPRVEVEPNQDPPPPPPRDFSQPRVVSARLLISNCHRVYHESVFL